MNETSWNGAGEPRWAAPRALLTGEGLKETFLSAGNLPAAWPLHLARARRGATILGLPWPGAADLAKGVLAAIDGHWDRHGPLLDHQRLRMRLLLLAGGEAGPLHRLDSVQVQVDVTTLGRSEVDLSPRRLALGPRLRAPDQPLAGCKTLAMAADLVALRQARDAGFDDVLICDHLGRFAETPIANLVFGLSDGRVVTPGPASGAVAGTLLARLAALDRAPWRVSPADLSVAHLAGIHWGVMVNAVRGAWPVAALGERALMAPPAAWLLPLQDWAWAAIDDAELDPGDDPLRQ